MENYRKTATRQEEPIELAGADDIPIIKVNSNGKVKNYVNAASNHFKVPQTNKQFN